MAKKSGKIARFKIQRRLGTELPGFGKPGALDRKPYPPGENINKRRKYSDFALRLEAKQKIRFHYQLKETQLRRFIKRAKKGGSINWVNKLAGLLERRLDNVVFRLNIAPSIRAAKQLISHNHILVNGQQANISSMILNEGDTVALKEKAKDNQSVLQAKQNPRMDVPSFLKCTHADEEAIPEGVVLSTPTLEHIPFEFNSGLFTEYYAAKKV